MPKLLLHVAAWYQPEEQADKNKWEAGVSNSERGNAEMKMQFLQ